jgi:hypothetical protein
MRDKFLCGKQDVCVCSASLMAGVGDRAEERSTGLVPEGTLGEEQTASKEKIVI